MRIQLVLWTLALALWTRPAAAGPNETPKLFARNPEQPDLWVLNYENSYGGLLISTDAGKHWGMMCGHSFDGRARSDTYGLAIAGDGTIFLGDFFGVLAGREQGCSWTTGADAGIPESWVSDVQLDPRDPNRVFAVTSTYTTENGLWAYDATSHAWSALGQREAALGISSLVVVPRGDGLRFYVSVSRINAEDEPEYLIRFSDDEGTTWNEYAYGEMTARYFNVVAADPTNPDRLVVAERNETDGGDPDRILISDQAGAPGSFRMLADDTHLAGATFDDTGVLYIGRWNGDMLVVPEPGAAPELRKLYRTGRKGCPELLLPRTLHFDPELGLMAGLLESFGPLDGATGEFTSLMEFRELDAFAVCPGRDLVADCRSQLTHDAWCVSAHLPQAPLCLETYPSPGPIPDAPALPECVPEVTEPTGGAGTAASGGTAGTATSGGTMEQSETPDAEDMDATAGGAAEPGSGSIVPPWRRSGCDCSAAGGRLMGAQDGFWGALALLALLWRRRPTRKSQRSP